MKINYLISILLIVACSTKSRACTCFDIEFNICYLVENGNNAVILKGKILDKREHYSGIHSLLIEVEKRFISTESVTDTIELVGGTDSGACQENLSYLEIGESKYFAFDNTHFNVINFEGLEPYNSQYWRYSPNYCNTIILTEKNDQVYGPISDNIISYPKNEFDDRIEDCSFKKSEIEEHICPDYIFFPNPVLSDKLYIRDIGSWELLNNLTIYSIDGRKLFNLKGQLDKFVIKLPKIEDQLVLLEYYCGSQRKIQKLYVKNN